MADFLLEIGTEEIPARMLDGAIRELHQRVQNLITRERLALTGEEDNPVQEFYSTPRRLAVVFWDVADRQPDVEEQLTGPAVKVAYKDGQPTAAAHAFAKKAGVDVAKLEKVTTPKGEYLSAKVTQRGRTAAEILKDEIPKEIAGLYWAKNMYWRGKAAERFVRPVRWLVAMLDDQVLPLEFGGVTAGRETRDHRILGNAPIPIPTARAYAKTLSDAHVIPSNDKRRFAIRHGLDAATRTVPGARWREDTVLLETVINLTEFPSVVLGNFEREYLELPEEVLVTVMRDHQKYFAIEDGNGKLMPHFLAVLNTDADPADLIRHGNERVLRARFNDARFFWKTDQKHPLSERVEMLKSVTFQKDLGNYWEKTQRIERLSEHLAGALMEAGFQVEETALMHAAHLCKTDLTTELVKEFTELQGVVGGLYARAQGIEEKAAIAIYDHYRPESTDDAVPRTIEGAVVALADKADSIAGMFALGLVPSGSKDPFALRRAGNGIVRILAEHNLGVPVLEIFAGALHGYRGSAAQAKFSATETYANDVGGFMRERLEFYLKDVRGFAYDVVNAVLASSADDVPDAVRRAEAVASVRGTPDFDSIAAAFKRVKNILRQAQEKKFDIAERAARSALKEREEIELSDRVQEAVPRFAELREQGSYEEALSELATLRPLIDAFFDKVMVMVEDETLRENRLGLLQTLVLEFSTIADFSEMVIERN